MDAERRTTRQNGRPLSWQSSTGRGRGSQFGDRRPKIAPKPNQAIAEPLGALLQVLVPGQGADPRAQVHQVKPVIQQCNFVASYNWLDAKRATILVPGSPPAWLPPSIAPKLKEDSGTYYRDPNAARYPSAFEPAIRALLSLRPEFDCPAVDVVGCGNTFGSLLSACQDSDERSFSFGVERVGTTIFLVRQTPPKEVIEDVRGYGHSFPDTYTTWPKAVKGSASHQRLVQYNFAHIHCLLRSESDGYLPHKVSPDKLPCALHNLGTKDGKLEDAARSLKVSQTTQTTHSKLVVKPTGKGIPQTAVFDLKTRSALKNISIHEFLPRLWLNQTPNFILARHRRGVFDDIEIHDVRDDVKQWEEANSKVLLRLQNVLSKLLEITQTDGCSRIQVRRVATEPLEIRKPTKEWTILPEDLRARWLGETPTETEKVPSEDSDSDDQPDEDYLKF